LRLLGWNEVDEEDGGKNDGEAVVVAVALILRRAFVLEV
jgi:hypothetical protein